VTEVTPTSGEKLVRGVLSVMDQQIDIVGESPCRLVILAEPVRTPAEAERAVIGEVGEGAVPVVQAVPEGPSPLVRYFEREDGDRLDLVRPRLQRAEGPTPLQLGKVDRKVRRRHRSGEDLLGRGALSRNHQANLRRWVVSP
jgi:hypothetical protein